MINLEITGKKISIDMLIDWKHYGQYNIIAYVYNQEKNGNSYIYTFHSTDSELYDSRKNENINNEEYQTMLFSAVETKLIERIEERINECKDNNC